MSAVDVTEIEAADKQLDQFAEYHPKEKVKPKPPVKKPLKPKGTVKPIFLASFCFRVNSRIKYCNITVNSKSHKNNCKPLRETF